MLRDLVRATHEQDKDFSPLEASLIITVIRNYNVELPAAIVIWERPLGAEMSDRHWKEKKSLVSAFRQILLFQQLVSNQKHEEWSVTAPCWLEAGHLFHIMKRTLNHKKISRLPQSYDFSFFILLKHLSNLKVFACVSISFNFPLQLAPVACPWARH